MTEPDQLDAILRQKKLKRIEKVTLITSKYCHKCEVMKYWLKECMRAKNKPFKEVDIVDLDLDFEVKLADLGYTIQELPVIVAHRQGGRIQVWTEQEMRDWADREFRGKPSYWNALNDR